MCGIAGIIAEEPSRYLDNMQSMLKAIRHRGPDGAGSHLFDHCILGHTRLSIIDLQTGDQPMLNTNGHSGITFNGEIYGYKDLKKQFTEYSFKTNSDTEVIVAMYDTYGIHMMDKLPGMFAFAIWDSDKQRLFCARDRFGEKPFYYAKGKNGEFIFASEIKAILATGLVHAKLNMKSINHYLQKLYIHPSETVYSNIFSLPPAHILILENGIMETKKYWSLPAINKTITLDEAVEEFRFLLKNSVKKQLIADVPVSAFLSGGLDSSTIAAIASEYAPRLTSFSFAFGNSIDETKLAEKTSEKFNLNFKRLQSDDFNLGDLILKMQSIYDEPFADSSNIPTYLISAEASKYTKVALTGDGGDELMGGYSYWYLPLLKRYEENKKISGNFFKNPLRNLASGIRKGPDRDFKAKNESPNQMIDFHRNQNIYFTNPEIKLLTGLEYDHSTHSVDFTMDGTPSDGFNLDLMDYMPGDILVKTDRASMANGLELRSPFLDVNFATFCISLPFILKLNASKTKIILRKSFEHLWIEEIKNNPKQGFGAPVKEWLKKKEIAEMKYDFLANPNSKIFQLIDFNTANRYYAQDDYRTWILLILAIWLEKDQSNSCN
jgi:asparagine synthase (glutamine-hydrolysing)